MQDPQKTPHCVSTETIALLAMGCDDDAQDMIHISQCERCSATLRDALEDLQRDPTPEELAIAENIPAPSPQRKSAGRSKPLWPLAIAAAMLVLVSFAVYSLVAPHQQETLSARLSQVYSTHRTMDFRLAPGDVYSEVRVQRSETNKSPYASIALAIEEGLEKNPNHQGLLRDKGRLALLEGRYDEAIATLSSVAGDHTTDLAAAYFQRGQQRSSNEDREQAFTLYRNFAREHPSDAVTAFNLAVVAASIRPAGEAIALFEKHIALEPSPEWRQEAERRMASLRELP